MSAVSLRLPESLYREARRLAQSDGITLNQLIVTALSEKLAVLETESYLKERADRGDRAAFDSVLSRVNGTREPVVGDGFRRTNPVAEERMVKEVAVTNEERVVREMNSNYDASTSRPRHTWSEDDDLIVYCLYRLDDKIFDVFQRLDLDREKLADVLGMGLASLNYKIANFKYLDTGKGLEGYSRQAQRIYEKYREFSDTKLRFVLIEAMERELVGED